jgi:hypothetical protein
MPLCIHRLPNYYFWFCNPSFSLFRFYRWGSRHSFGTYEPLIFSFYYIRCKIYWDSIAQIMWKCFWLRNVPRKKAFWVLKTNNILSLYPTSETPENEMATWSQKHTKKIFFFFGLYKILSNRRRLQIYDPKKFVLQNLNLLYFLLSSYTFWNAK